MNSISTASATVLLLCSLAGCSSYAVKDAGGIPYLYGPSRGCPLLAVHVGPIKYHDPVKHPKVPADRSNAAFTICVTRHGSTGHLQVLLHRDGILGSNNASLTDDVRKGVSRYVCEHSLFDGSPTAEQVATDLSGQVAEQLHKLRSEPAETLFQRYRYCDPSWAGVSIQLQPGMRLRLFHAILHRTNNTTAELIYTGTGESTIKVVTINRAKSLLGLEGLDLEDGRKKFEIDGGNQHRWIATPLDFIGSGSPPGAAKYLWVVWPTTMENSDRVEMKEDKVTTLVRTDNPDWRPNCAYDENSYPFMFRGHVTVVPEIQITVNGQPQYVPVGTTIGQLLEPSGEIGGCRVLSRVSVKRWACGHRVPVRLCPSTRYADPKSPVFDLPVLKGDEIEW